MGEVPDRLEKEVPFILGIDRSGETPSFSTHPERFSVPGLLSPRGNDASNHSMLAALKEVGIDGLFVNDDALGRPYLSDPNCRGLLYHGRIEEMSDTAQLVVMRRELIFVLLFSESNVPMEMRETVSPVIEGERDFYTLPGDIYAVIKPFGIFPLVAFLQRHLSQLQT